MTYNPKNTKFAKSFKGRLINNSPKTLTLNEVYTNSVMLFSKESGRINPSHLECLNNTIKRVLKKNTKIILSVFPHTPITEKPLEVRMGKGKGSVSFWSANIFSGTPLLKIYTADAKNISSVEVLKNLKKKLPVNTRVTFYK